MVGKLVVGLLLLFCVCSPVLTRDASSAGLLSFTAFIADQTIHAQSVPGSIQRRLANSKALVQPNFGLISEAAYKVGFNKLSDDQKEFARKSVEGIAADIGRYEAQLAAGFQDPPANKRDENYLAVSKNAKKAVLPDIATAVYGWRFLPEDVQLAVIHDPTLQSGKQ